MIRVTRLVFCVAALALATGPWLPAQSDPQTGSDAAAKHVEILPAPLTPDDLPPGRMKELPAPELHPSSLFDLNSTVDSGRSIQILSEDQMNGADRDRLADAQSSIRERAGYEDFDLNAGGWKYEELVCPALPNHLFVRFTRNDGTREMSMFSAAIPRNGTGRVHIIPILRKGYSLFSPAPVGALTMAAFNRIRTEEGKAASADWLGTGLCYAALAGSNPEAPGPKASGDTPETLPPTIVVDSEGGTIIRFEDISAVPPMQWNMIFDQRGKLVKASHARIEANGSQRVKINTQAAVPATETLPPK